AVLLQPRPEIGGAAAQFDDLEPAKWRQHLEMRLRRVPPTPGDLLLRPCSLRAGRRVVGVRHRPHVAVSDRVLGQAARHRWWLPPAKPRTCAATPGFALQRSLAQHVEGTPGLSQPSHAVVNAAGPQPGLRDQKSLAALAEQAFLRDANVLVQHLSVTITKALVLSCERRDVADFFQP